MACRLTPSIAERSSVTLVAYTDDGLCSRGHARRPSQSPFATQPDVMKCTDLVAIDHPEPPRQVGPAHIQQVVPVGRQHGLAGGDLASHPRHLGDPARSRGERQGGAPPSRHLLPLHPPARLEAQEEEPQGGDAIELLPPVLPAAATGPISASVTEVPAIGQCSSRRVSPVLVLPKGGRAVGPIGLRREGRLRLRSLVLCSRTDHLWCQAKQKASRGPGILTCHVGDHALILGPRERPEGGDRSPKRSPSASGQHVTSQRARWARTRTMSRPARARVPHRARASSEGRSCSTPPQTSSSPPVTGHNGGVVQLSAPPGSATAGGQRATGPHAWPGHPHRTSFPCSLGSSLKRSRNCPEGLAATPVTPDSSSGKVAPSIHLAGH
jgi:hypothetical protein